MGVREGRSLAVKHVEAGNRKACRGREHRKGSEPLVMREKLIAVATPYAT